MEHLLVILLSVTFVPFRCLWKFKPLHTNISYILVWIHAEAEIVTQFGGACSPWTARIVLSIQQKLLEQYLFTPTWCTSSILHFALLLAPELLNTVLFFAYFVVRKLHTAPLIVFFYLFFLQLASEAEKWGRSSFKGVRGVWCMSKCLKFTCYFELIILRLLWKSKHLMHKNSCDKLFTHATLPQHVCLLYASGR